ncbi:kinesin-like protein [Achlya hypogyna]|uniref:Kinesin-like protein n=1 Tax=Achlya hypogyna TaxID=1202772 RepID=A0A1V9Z2Z0_ACHHY|nr:kinesin-like protein [Achlya hypogyna]
MASSNDVNVKVAVRCRPMSGKETQMGASTIVGVQDTMISIRNPADDDIKKFTFDYAYSVDSQQTTVYTDVARPLVDQAFQGYNGTIFAYGQTGSGKTHTMMGSGDDHGIIPKMNFDLFEYTTSTATPGRVAAQTDVGTKYLITVSFLEIYNEVIKDLLNPSDKVLKIREHPDMGIYVEHLAEVLVVREPSDVSRLIDEGNKVRQVAATQMNERSSRSHSCFTIKIGSKKIETLGDMTRETAMNAKINLVCTSSVDRLSVDLAGSERAAKTGATGDRLKEGAAINKSLSALGNVINMLADRSKKGHVPYRDSKLTRLLQESLGGNSLTVMIAAVSPADYNYDESLGTLQYANRAKSIKNATRKNEDVNEKMIRELREEIERLRQMVQGNSVTVPSNPDALREMDEMIANLERAKQQSWEEKERLAALYEAERQKSMANETNILAFMQTVKEEKIDGIKRVKHLHQAKAKIAKELRERKESYNTIKKTLTADIQSYQELVKVNEHDGRVPGLLSAIDHMKESLIAERDALAGLKDQQKTVEEKILEEEADIAAKSAVLQENEKLRQAIQDDERQKMKLEKESFLEQALADERKRLQSQAEDDRLKLESILSESVDKEKRLAEEVVRQRDRALALNEEVHRLKHKFAEAQTQTKAHLLTMLGDLTAAWDAERTQMERKYAQAVHLLQQAHGDIVHLSTRNAVLEASLREALLWEHPV